MSDSHVSGINDLLQAFGLLAMSVQEEPLLCLANAVAWLDPLWEFSDDVYEYEDGDHVGLALYITRSVFPDIYAGCVEQMRCGASYNELDNYICTEITKRGIPLDHLEYIGWGIPLTACGVELVSPEWHDAHPHLLPLLNLFGIQPETGCYSVEVPECAYEAGRLIADSLTQHGDKRWQQVGWLIAWLFSCSGNTLVDFDDEALADVPPLEWDEDGLAFALELIAETDELMSDVFAGMELLQSQPEMWAAMSENVKRVYKALAKQKGKRNASRIRLEWPPLVTGDDGTTVTDSELLQLRGDAA